MRDGIIYTRNLELDAMEVQFVRGIRMTEEDAIKVRETAEEAGIELHVKAPYYINLAGDERNIEMSAQKILATGRLAHLMGAETVVIHPGFYGEMSKEETANRVVENLRNIRNVFVREGWKPRLGVEVMGKRNVFGSLDEVLDVCSRVKGIVPVVDFAHIHARGNGILQNPEDFLGVFERLATLGIKHHLVHFTGIHYENGNARYRLPIKKGDLKFEPLCEVLLEHNISATIISTSPILEHDAMYMNIVFDRVKERRDARIAREMREAQEAEEKRKRDEERKKIAEEEKRVREEEAAIKKAEADAEAERKRVEEEKRKAEEAARKRPCEALTKTLEPCKKYAREKAKFCIQHKGWRGHTLGDLCENMIPEVTQTDDSGRKQVSVPRVYGIDQTPSDVPEIYKLYKKEERYYFSKTKKEGFSLVFKVPDGKEVAYNRNGVPLLRNAKE